MLSKISESNKILEHKIQNELNSYIDSSKSLVFQSGAGAGKTYALVESLKYIINKYGSTLSKHNQRILCITYTNVAANEMKERLGASQIVKISTIHERIWELIKRYKSQLVDIHKEKVNYELFMLEKKLISHEDFNAYQSLSMEEKQSFQQIMLKQKNNFYKVYHEKSKEVEKVFKPILSDFSIMLSNKEKFKKTVRTIYDIFDFKQCIEKIEASQSGYREVLYTSNYNSDRLHRMQISHDTLLEYGLNLIQRYDLVKQIIIDQYPYILIDEYQDTNRNVIKIMNILSDYAQQLNRDFFVGYFGDPVQNIYEDGIGSHLENIHLNLMNVKKIFNRRSYQEIIEVTNKIRNDDISQVSIYDDASGGSVKFYYGVQDDVDSFIQKYSDKWIKDKDNTINCFFLRHNSAAHFSGFGNIYDIFSNTKKYQQNYKQLTTELLDNDPTKLGEVPKLLFNIVRFIKQLRSGKSSILEIYSNQKFYEYLSLNELQNMINLLIKINGVSLHDYLESISNIYIKSQNSKLQKLIDDTIGFEKINYQSFHRYLLEKLFPDIKEKDYKVAIETISELLSINLRSFEKWYEYIQMRDKRKNILHNKINYHTYHSTKGIEFTNVLIILENKFNRENDFFEFYFKHYNNVKNLNEEELDKFIKAKNLLYVACSRAVKNLRILYLDDISEVKENLIEIFGEIQKYNNNP